MLRLIVMMLVLATAVSSLAAEPAYWSKIAGTIAVELSRAEAQARAGKPDEAKQTITAAYFDLFENTKMEAALRKEIGAKHAALREKGFADLRKLVGKGAPAADIAAIAEPLRTGLADDGKALDKAGIPPDVFAVNQ
jgi:hypothetical protein